MPPQFVIFALASLILGSGAGYFLGRFTSGAILYLLWGALVGAGLVLLVGPLSDLAGLYQDDWSRAAHRLAVAIFVAPALVSSALTGWIGLRARARRLQGELEQ